jgi:hypothetical protein
VTEAAAVEDRPTTIAKSAIRTLKRIPTLTTLLLLSSEEVFKAYGLASRRKLQPGGLSEGKTVFNRGALSFVGMGSWYNLAEQQAPAGPSATDCPIRV